MQEDSAQHIADKILQFVDLEGQVVLEIGCGNGRVTELISAKPKRLIAIDPLENEIEEARKKCPEADFQIGSGENLNFLNGHFDTVLFTLSLHHQDSHAALNEAQRVLKDDGTILVIEPTYEGEVEQIFEIIHPEKQAKLEAQKAIQHGNLLMLNSERFFAHWVFDSKEEVCQFLFKYHDMSYDQHLASRVTEVLDVEQKTAPIVLKDTMVIQVLKKVSLM